jgi:galactokinase
MKPDASELGAIFRELHGVRPRLFAAPGRVNLIGEHTDYNDGFVLPTAIDRCTVVAAAPRDDRRVVVSSLNISETLGFDLDGPVASRQGSWLAYVEGVARILEERGARLGGATLLLVSDVPEGAGLSSSAALEISSGLAMTAVSGIDVDRIALALAGQSAEHRFVGTMSGIMDQYVAALGRAGHALLIDCRSLEATPIPVVGAAYALVICDTGVKHSLASSAYNTRRSECERGVELLREVLPSIKALRDVSVEEIERYGHLLPEPIRSRCRHVVTENARTLAAAEALRAGDFDTMGRLMAESHRSLRDDYRVSCEELDLLVELAGGVEGAVGARMTGGGFGGCTVNFVRRDALDRFRERITRGYRDRTGRDATIYVAEIGEGARELHLS